MAKKRFAEMTDKEKKADRVRRQLEYAKTDKGKASIARRVAKSAKKLSPVQMVVLKALKEGAYLRVWHQDVHPFGRHCELRSRDNRVLKSKMHTHTFELLQSEEKQGMLLEIKSKREDETIYVISKKGLGVRDKELKKDD
jgi:hypothetical protein